MQSVVVALIKLYAELAIINYWEKNITTQQLNILSAYPPSPARDPIGAGQQASSDSAAGSLFSSLKMGAGSLMKNVKDASAKVVETVSAYVRFLLLC